MLAILSSLLLTAETEYRAGLDAVEDAKNARPHFRKSAQLYEQAWREGDIDSPELHRNRAQAYLLADDLPNALRAYHEGRRSWPADDALKEGQAFSRSQVTYPSDGQLQTTAMPRSPWRLRSTFSLEWIRIGILIGCVVGWLGVALARTTYRREWWALPVIGWGLAVLLGVTLWIESAQARTESPWAVVATDGVLLRSGNGTSFAPRIDDPLPEGVEVSVRHRRGGWAQVELADGTLGWLPERDLIWAHPRTPHNQPESEHAQTLRLSGSAYCSMHMIY